MPKAMTIVDTIAAVYLRQGEGKDVLLLHGWGDDHRTFSHLVTALSKHYRVTAVDLPGFGATEQPKTAWDLTDYATWLEHFCAKAVIDPYVVIGHSNGGALAIHAIAHHKLQPKKLVLLASSGVRNIANLQRTGIKIIAKTGKIATFWLPYETKRKLQKTLYGTVGSDMLVAPTLIETFKRTVRQDIQDDASKLKIPTLLLYGNNDKATPVSDGKRLHGLIKGSTFTQVHGAGHFVHHDSAAKVTKQIEEFIK